MLKKIFITSSVCVAFLVPAIAFAGPLDSGIGKLNTALSGTQLQSDVTVSIGGVVRAILSLVGTIFLLLTIYAGILWMTAQGAAEQIEKAQSIVSAAIIGLFITMAAFAITTFVTGRLGTVGAGGSGAGGGGGTMCASLPKGKCVLPANCDLGQDAKGEKTADCPDPANGPADTRLCCHL